MLAVLQLLQRSWFSRTVRFFPTGGGFSQEPFELFLIKYFSNIPHTDDLYRNISLLGIAVANDDIVMMYKLIKDGCDINYEGTAIQWIIDDDDQPWVTGQTPLHIASLEGSQGE